MLKPLIDWYLSVLETGGYPLVALLMAIESSIVPLPSELIIPPAAHLAHTKGTFSMAGLVIAGALGSWIGAASLARCFLRNARSDGRVSPCWIQEQPGADGSALFFSRSPLPC